MNARKLMAWTLAGLVASGSAAWAALPKPALTQAQQEAAAAKKAEADAKAARDKELLAASIDSVSARWRAQAPAKGWRINPPVAIVAAPAAPAAAAPAAGAVPAGVTPPSAGMPAAAPANAAPGTAAAAPATGAAPLSRQALNAANVPVKSEKLGTAAPSEDVKRSQTKAVPKGVGPAVEKDSTPKTANKQ